MKELEGMHDGDHECRRCGLPFPVGAAPRAEGLDAQTLAVAINDAQIDPDDIRLGRHLLPVAERILACLRPSDERAGEPTGG